MTATQELRCLQLGCLQSCCSLLSLEQTLGSKKLPGHRPWPQCRHTHGWEGKQNPQVPVAISGTGGFLPTQNLLQELSVELSSWAQQPVHIRASWGAVVLLSCVHSWVLAHREYSSHLLPPCGPSFSTGHPPGSRKSSASSAEQPGSPSLSKVFYAFLHYEGLIFFLFTVSMSSFLHNMGDDYFFKESTEPVTS